MSRNEVPDALYPTTNGLGIPELRPESAATAIPAPIGMWGSRQSRRNKWRGTIGFFCDDYRFEALWADPSHILETECRWIWTSGRLWLALRDGWRCREFRGGLGGLFCHGLCSVTSLATGATSGRS